MLKITILSLRFRALGRLESKFDETLIEYYLAFMAMCKRVAGMELSEEEGKKENPRFIYGCSFISPCYENHMSNNFL